MYFKSFPYTYYSLDNTATAQLITNITTRIALSDEVKNNLSIYDEYDIKDGETPEIVADRFYGNPQLHWIILHTNEILDARFDWPLTSDNLNKYIAGKYASASAVHHHIDVDSNYTNANVTLTSSAEFSNFSINDVIINATNIGTGYITAKADTSTISVTITEGGFITGDQIRLSTNANVVANVSTVTTLLGTPVTNYDYENELNEERRRIKILKATFVDGIVREFKKKLES